MRPVYPESLALPESVLQDFGVAPSRRTAVSPFTTGLPELFVCTSSVPFLQLFPYFWPIATDEFQRARNSIRVLFQVDQLSRASRQTEPNGGWQLNRSRAARLASSPITISRASSRGASSSPSAAPAFPRSWSSKTPGCHPTCATLLRVRSAFDAHLRDLSSHPSCKGA